MTMAVPYPVQLEFDADRHITRWRPLVQWLLVIPHLMVAYALRMLRQVLTFISFFTVLFTEQIPRQHQRHDALHAARGGLRRPAHRQLPTLQPGCLTPSPERRPVPSPAYPAALRVLSRGVGTNLHATMLAALTPVGGTDPVIYLADFSHRTLIPVPTGDGNGGRQLGDEEISSTMAGRAFITRQPVT